MKSYFLEFTTQSEREFFDLPTAIQKRIKSKMEHFLATGNPLKWSKKLMGWDNAYRFRIGDYRIIVSPKEKGVFVILIILKIGHRREVYE